MKREIAGICSDKFRSVTRMVDKGTLQDFSYAVKCIRDEMKSKASAIFILDIFFETKEKHRHHCSIDILYYVQESKADLLLLSENHFHTSVCRAFEQAKKNILMSM
jgi:hypothetical protein